MPDDVASVPPLVRSPARLRRKRDELLALRKARRLGAEYARAAVVVMPSRYEGLGLVALEAQAYKLAQRATSTTARSRS